MLPLWPVPAFSHTDLSFLNVSKYDHLPAPSFTSQFHPRIVLPHTYYTPPAKTSRKHLINTGWFELFISRVLSTLSGVRDNKRTSMYTWNFFINSIVNRGFNDQGLSLALCSEVSPDRLGMLRTQPSLGKCLEHCAMALAPHAQNFSHITHQNTHLPPCRTTILLLNATFSNHCVNQFSFCSLIPNSQVIWTVKFYHF